MAESDRLLERFSRDFMGLDCVDPVRSRDGRNDSRRRVYLDTAATALMSRPVWRAMQAYLERAAANSHTEAHRAGRDTTTAIEESRDAIGRLVGYDPSRDVVLFTANGATGAINFMARALFPPELRTLVKRYPSAPPATLVDEMKRSIGRGGVAAIDRILARPVVVTTCMEHHSNLLPWMEAVGHHNVRAVKVDAPSGELDLDDLQRILDAENGRVRLVAVTGVSNVSGVINPVARIARMAHAAGAQILVDGAQWVPHGPVRMHTDDPAETIDYLVLSGHKMYAPGSRGALVGTLETLSKARCVTDVGGGMVEYVSIEDYEIKDQVTAREEAGTPNIPGSVAMGVIAELLMQVGMERLEAAEQELTRQLLARLDRVEGVTVYGELDVTRVRRAGVVAFGVDGLDHGLVAAYLNDSHNIAVRDGCFCAHPYVKSLLGVDAAADQLYRQDRMRGDRRRIPGMVRASLGVYSTGEDVELLGRALEELVADADRVRGAYEETLNGSFRLKGSEPMPQTFRVSEAVAAWTQPSPRTAPIGQGR
jgi:selenocysteine lyase/cysteine desulfurase